MQVSTLLEVFGEILFSFTRGVTEYYNPEEPEFTTESFGYDPLQSTGRECITILCMSLFTKNTVTRKSQARPLWRQEV